LEESKFDLIVSNFGSTSNLNDCIIAIPEGEINLESYILMSLASNESFVDSSFFFDEWE